MKYVLRSSLILIVAFVLGGLLSVPASAQVPNPKYDSIFAKAKAMEDTEPYAKALDAYTEIKKQYSESGKDQEVAAEALLRAALFASGPRCGAVDVRQFRQKINATDPTNTPQSVKDLQISSLADGEHKAHDAVKQLFKEFPQSASAAYAHQPNWNGVDLQQSIENSIDQRNSTSFSYKIVDALVGATGRVPAFSYWFALALIAVLVKLITLPITLRMYRSQREMQRIQPILKDIQDKYKGKPELNEKVMATYKEHGVNPFASCIPMFIQLPFMIWVYNMIRQYEYHFSHGTLLWIGTSFSHRYPNYLATNLAQFDVILLLIYAGSNYLTMKLTPPSDPAAAQQQKSMSLMMTGVMLWMFLQYRWSSAFIFYWLVLNFVSAWQQYVFIYKKRKDDISSGSGGTAQVTSTLALASGPTGQNGKSNSNGSGTASPPRDVTPIPGGDAPRPRPRRKRR